MKKFNFILLIWILLVLCNCKKKESVNPDPPQIVYNGSWIRISQGNFINIEMEDDRNGTARLYHPLRGWQMATTKDSGYTWTALYPFLTTKYTKGVDINGQLCYSFNNQGGNPTEGQIFKEYTENDAKMRFRLLHTILGQMIGEMIMVGNYVYITTSDSAYNVRLYRMDKSNGSNLEFIRMFKGQYSIKMSEYKNAILYIITRDSSYTNLELLSFNGSNWKTLTMPVSMNSYSTKLFPNSEISGAFSLDNELYSYNFDQTITKIPLIEKMRRYPNEILIDAKGTYFLGSVGSIWVSDSDTAIIYELKDGKFIESYKTIKNSIYHIEMSSPALSNYIYMSNHAGIWRKRID